MTPWFQKKERQDALEAAADAWAGTPFVAHSATRGPQGGVDCVHLAHELMAGAGAMERATLPPDYSLDHAHHSTSTMLLRWILDCPQLAGRVAMIPPQGRILPGDLYGLRSGRVDHHLAIALRDGQIVHAVAGRGVLIHGASDRKFQERILYVLRIFEPDTVIDAGGGQ
ncbi:hypothetical protein OPIT5_08385 [Opitutaceae bacterium TAV5]|nr:hypothetical protein OPIT5_08385 [Opitutaceae bacterium TAV5]